MRKILFISFWFSLAAWATTAWAGVLEDYIKQPDSSYTYSLAESYSGPDYKVYILDMTFQTWHPNDLDKPVWRHWVSLFVPNRVETDTALLIVTGGKNEHRVLPQLSGREYQLAQEVVVKTNSVVVVLQGVPSEPLVFRGEGKERSEDEIVAYSWRKYLDTGDSTWPPCCLWSKARFAPWILHKIFLRNGIYPL